MKIPTNPFNIDSTDPHIISVSGPTVISNPPANIQLQEILNKLDTINATLKSMCKDREEQPKLNSPDNMSLALWMIHVTMINWICKLSDHDPSIDSLITDINNIYNKYNIDVEKLLEN